MDRIDRDRRAIPLPVNYAQRLLTLNPTPQTLGSRGPVGGDELFPEAAQPGGVMVLVPGLQHVRELP